ncbi:hypothetical protein CY34DRAFT_528112 [Suillus luteus UH-Slu-Lm8-n1]|uniref:Cytochrome P450 n=1 Tax=Suillus luteus UH-Slu-Lm8-n1 TaxID=930992 RepID=A0A0C9ZFW1_9AGAM|nr:hypothetical protein CY34DRAFT_528112 [Suillus luteus UH-Slu-Lm8-n1]
MSRSQFGAIRSQVLVASSFSADSDGATAMPRSQRREFLRSACEIPGIFPQPARYLNLSDRAIVGKFEQICWSANPDNFEPLSWLLSDGNPVVREDLKFPSFGFGQRIYPGGQIADRLIFIDVVLLLWAFKITKTLKTLLTSLVLWMG